MRGCPFGHSECRSTCAQFSGTISGAGACWYFRPAIPIRDLGIPLDGESTGGQPVPPTPVVKIFVTQGVRSYVPQKPPVIPSKSTGFHVDLQAIERGDNEPS